MTETNFKNPNEKEYIESIVAKFNTDKNDPTLSNSERALLSMVLETENKIGETKVQIVELQNKMNHLQSQSMAFIDSLIALKRVEEVELSLTNEQGEKSE